MRRGGIGLAQALELAASMSHEPVPTIPTRCMGQLECAPVFHYHQVIYSLDQGINIFWYFLGPVTWISR